jgi:hypothetical protein
MEDGIMVGMPVRRRDHMVRLEASEWGRANLAFL